MDDTSFGLDRQTYSKLSKEDLQSLGKQASIAYLSSGVSLNDAIVKLAQQHPSISSHQILRVVEFANQETFSRLFSDEEKYASDKSIDFEVADPGEVLQTLDKKAAPSVVVLPDSDYHCGPIKCAAALDAAEADVELAREFGFDMVSPAAEQAVFHKNALDLARAGHLDRIIASKEKTSSVADRILATSEDNTSGSPASVLSQESMSPDAMAMSADEAAIKEGMGGPEGVMMNAQPQQHPEVTHRANMRQMEQRVELEKKKQELAAMQSKTIQTPGDMGGAPPPGAPQQGQPPAGPPSGGPQGGPPVQGAPSAIPAESPPGAPQIKQGSALMHEALAYARKGRTKMASVVRDIEQATSLDKIKLASSLRPQYREANPFGELIRAKQKIACVHEGAVQARDKNEFLMKEAESRFLHATTQHVLGGGNLGELAHAMQFVPGNDNVIAPAMVKAAEHLVGKGVDSATLRSQMIPYEMSKVSNVRAINPQHPVLQSFGALCKVSNAQPVLARAAETAAHSLGELEGVLSQALRASHARTA